MVQCSPPTNLTQMPQSTKMLVESDDKPNEDNDLGLLNGFHEFMEKCVKDQLSLSARMDF